MFFKLFASPASETNTKRTKWCFGESEGDGQRLLELAERRHDGKIMLHGEFGLIYSRHRYVIINHAITVTPETVPSQKRRNIYRRL